MGKIFRLHKKLRKSHSKRGKLTFGDYKKLLHCRQKIKKRTRKNYLKVKSILSQGRQYVVVGNVFYYWGEDKKTIVALKLGFDLTSREFGTIKKRDSMEDSNGRIL